MSSVTTLKKSERLKLARKIENSGNEMAVPYSYYKKQNRKCIVDNERSAWCTEYVRRKLSCDVLIDDWEQNVPCLND